jgi:hypothetical protein
VARRQRSGAQARECERGQASVELLGILPAALLVVLAGWQLVLAGHTLWLAGNAARAGARAQTVGADPGSAVRRSLPSYLRRGLSVNGGQDGQVRVRVRIPIVAPAWGSPLHVSAAAALENE